MLRIAEQQATFRFGVGTFFRATCLVISARLVRVLAAYVRRLRQLCSVLNLVGRSCPCWNSFGARCKAVS